MRIESIITYISAIVWLFPPIRQYKTKYFLFFLILALKNSFNEAALHMNFSNPLTIDLIAAYLILASLVWRKISLKSLIIFLTGLLLLIIAGNYLTLFGIVSLKVILSSILVFIFSKDTILSFHKTAKINLFYLMLTFYEITIVIKFIDYITFAKIGVIYFNITTAFELLIGVFFIIYNSANSPSFKLFRSGIENLL